MLSIADHSLPTHRVLYSAIFYPHHDAARAPIHRSSSSNPPLPLLIITPLLATTPPSLPSLPCFPPTHNRHSGPLVLILAYLVSSSFTSLPSSRRLSTFLIPRRLHCIAYCRSILPSSFALPARSFPPALSRPLFPTSKSRVYRAIVKPRYPGLSPLLITSTRNPGPNFNARRWHARVCERRYFKLQALSCLPLLPRPGRVLTARSTPVLPPSAAPLSLASSSSPAVSTYVESRTSSCLFLSRIHTPRTSRSLHPCTWSRQRLGYADPTTFPPLPLSDFPPSQHLNHPRPSRRYLPLCLPQPTYTGTYTPPLISPPSRSPLLPGHLVSFRLVYCVLFLSSSSLLFHIVLATLSTSYHHLLPTRSPFPSLPFLYYTHLRYGYRRHARCGFHPYLQSRLRLRLLILIRPWRAKRTFALVSAWSAPFVGVQTGSRRSVLALLVDAGMSARRLLEGRSWSYRGWDGRGEFDADARCWCGEVVGGVMDVDLGLGEGAGRVGLSEYVLVFAVGRRWVHLLPLISGYLQGFGQAIQGSALKSPSSVSDSSSSLPLRVQILMTEFRSQYPPVAMPLSIPRRLASENPFFIVSRSLSTTLVADTILSRFFLHHAFPKRALPLFVKLIVVPRIWFLVYGPRIDFINPALEIHPPCPTFLHKHLASALQVLNLSTPRDSCSCLFTYTTFAIPVTVAIAPHLVVAHSSFILRILLDSTYLLPHARSRTLSSFLSTNTYNITILSRISLPYPRCYRDLLSRPPLDTSRFTTHLSNSNSILIIAICLTSLPTSLSTSVHTRSYTHPRASPSHPNSLSVAFMYPRLLTLFQSAILNTSFVVSCFSSLGTDPALSFILEHMLRQLLSSSSSTCCRVRSRCVGALTTRDSGHLHLHDVLAATSHSPHNPSFHLYTPHLLPRPLLVCGTTTSARRSSRPLRSICTPRPSPSSRLLNPLVSLSLFLRSYPTLLLSYIPVLPLL
ncbi:hypothetical protein R3P38DRAFT_3537494 [Favolaschia claudopus]|uniref:Uncharacterized protein n=1 Tax=Favolaschia claudopus TaxID=2862362 RepID=A0AAW0BBE2_9AGAR